MTTVRRALVVLGLLIGLGLAVETRPPVAQASCCGTPTYAGSLGGGWMLTSHSYSVSGPVYAAMQCTCGGPTTFNWMPVGVNMTTRVEWQPQTAGYYHFWTCQNSPHDCSASLGIQVGGCAGCASYSPQDGQIWDDLLHGPVRLGTQWNGSQWFGRPVGTRPNKGIGGGGSPCSCPWPYTVTYVNGVPYCYTPLPPFTYSYYPCS